jgi:hypothetical protein
MRVELKVSVDVDAGECTEDPSLIADSTRDAVYNALELVRDEMGFTHSLSGEIALNDIEVSVESYK